jgi:hypothetical protein
LPSRKKIGDARLDFIWSDLDVLLTFATIAEAEYRMGNREHAERTLANAEKGYTDMLSYFAKGNRADIRNRCGFLIEVQTSS